MAFSCVDTFQCGFGCALHTETRNPFHVLIDEENGCMCLTARERVLPTFPKCSSKDGFECSSA